MISYSGKQKFKLIILVAAIVVGTISFYLLLQIIENVKEEERKKVILWAEAIQKKIELVEYTNELFEKLKVDERTKVEIWSGAMHRIMNVTDSDDLTFLLKIISTNKNIPIILTNTKGKIISSINLGYEIEEGTAISDSLIARFSQYPPIEVKYNQQTLNYLYYQNSKLFVELQDMMNNMVRSFISDVVTNSASVPVIITDSLKQKIIAYGNIDSVRIQDSMAISKTLKQMENYNPPIVINWFQGKSHYIYYEDSYLLRSMKNYPIFFFAIIIVFITIAYLAFTSSRKFEQNQVWVGMSKETAHQLGTPISSLMAWMELLKLKLPDKNLTTEISKDVERLQIIADRFSKIGSNPIMQEENIVEVLQSAFTYIKVRSSKTFDFSFQSPESKIYLQLNRSLFEWVVENLCKNAIDAMGSKGSLAIQIQNNPKNIYIDITDTGKGIPRSKQHTVFKPGYTTKKRGWGLGLSLVKRIVEDYHKGKIFVLISEINFGTTFRIILNKTK